MKANGKQGSFMVKELIKMKKVTYMKVIGLKVCKKV